MNEAALINALANTRTNISFGEAKQLPLNNGEPVSPTYTIHPSTSGVMMHFYLRVHGTITNNGASDATRSVFGASNLIQYLTYTDTQGSLRHQTDGRGIELMNTARQGKPIGAVTSDESYGVEYSAWGGNTLPKTIAAGATVPFSHTFVIPLAFSNANPIGAILGFVTNSQQTLKVTFPTKSDAFIEEGEDALSALYTATGVNMKFGTLSYELYTATKNQGLPQNNGQYLLPFDTMAQHYILQSGTRAGVVNNADNYIPYTDGQTFFNTFVIFNNGGELNLGSDVDSVSIRHQGSQDTHRLPPSIAATEAGFNLSNGLPAGTYYKKHFPPLNTLETGGSADFTIKPKTVNNDAVFHFYNDYVTTGSLVL